MIAVSSKGKSFRALAQYLMGGRDTGEAERVAWTSARNLPTTDPKLAASFMGANAEQSHRVTKPVYHLVLSFDPRDPVNQALMERVTDRVLGRLGLADHEAVLVAHRDREHPHVHVMVNRIHPTRGTAWDLSHDFRRIQEALREIEQEFGLRHVPGRLGKATDIRSPFDVPERPTLTSGELRQEQRMGAPVFAERVRALAAELRTASSWAELDTRLATYGLRIEPKGQGLVITDGVHQVKASRVARDLSKRHLEGRFGIPYADRDRYAHASPAASMAAAVRRYEYARAIRARHFDVLTAAGRIPREPISPLVMEQQRGHPIDPALAGTRQARARRALAQVHAERRGLPDLRELRRAVEWGMSQLLPEEIKQLRRMLTPAELQLARSLRTSVRDLGRDREHEERAR